MIAVIYARYSDSKQTEQSIEGQLKVCHKYCAANGYEVLREYIDRAQSGKTDNRIQFKKMLIDSRKQKFDTVVVYTLDRFGRNLLQSLKNEGILKDNGVTVLSATEHTENTPSGRMQRNIHMTFAQYFSEELAQKTVRGMNINAENCLYNGGPVPLGYKIVDKKYELNKETAPIVQEIFTKYANDVSIKKICDNLNERHLRSAKGAAFNKNSLHTMLLNRKYLGIYIYGETEIPDGIPQIIDEDLFNKVADKMKLNKKLPARSRAKAEYLLTGKLFCGYCKEMMIGHSANRTSKGGVKYKYYRCKNQGGDKPCKKKMVHKDYIENIIINECRKILTPQNIHRIAKELVKIADSFDDKSEVIRLERLIKEAQEAKENHMISLRSCDNTVREMILEDLSKIAKEIKELEKLLEIENARREKITVKQIEDHLLKLVKGDINDIVYRRSLVRLFVNKIFLYDDKFTITFNTGSEEVTISDVLLENIESKLEDKSNCLIRNEGYQKIEATFTVAFIFI